MAENDSFTPKLLTSKEAAAYIGRNVRYLRRLTSQRLLPLYRYPGGLVRFDRHDLDGFLARHRVEQLRW
jgi:excisionase family DNA binding protein